jgi:hypothetical protein
MSAHPLPLVLAVAGLVSALLITVALAALARRRSLSYFLVTLALGTLLVRTASGVLSMRDVVPHPSHHLVEHALDIVTVALLLGAVYSARRLEGPTVEDGDGDDGPADDSQPTPDGGPESRELAGTHETGANHE